MTQDEITRKLEAAIIAGDEESARGVAQQVLDCDIDPLEVIQKGAIAGLHTIGERFQKLQAYLPELILAGDAMKACMTVLLPRIKKHQREALTNGSVVIGTVSGDVHDIGKNIVGSMLSATGFQVHDLGVDVATKEFVERAEELDAKIVALSSLMATTAPFQKDIVRYFDEKGLRNKHYIIVGGGPITPEWAKEIGADGFGRNAVDAAEVAKKLVTDGIPSPLSDPVSFGD